MGPFAEAFEMKPLSDIEKIEDPALTMSLNFEAPDRLVAMCFDFWIFLQLPRVI
jgi:hypothetical protein